MMELFIQIKDGLPFEHPIIGQNFREAFPGVDVDNLPPGFARFVRIPMPAIGLYQVYKGATYEWDGDIVKDVHHVRPMTDEEKTALQNLVKQQWAEGLGYSSWTFDEETCLFVPPIPYPQDGKYYYWDEPTVSWIEVI